MGPSGPGKKVSLPWDDAREADPWSGVAPAAGPPSLLGPWSGAKPVGAKLDLDFLRGLGQGLTTDLLGIPVDIGTAAINLGLMGGGVLGHELGLLSTDQLPSPIHDPVGGANWLAKQVGWDETPSSQAGRFASAFATMQPERMPGPGTLPIWVGLGAQLSPEERAMGIAASGVRQAEPLSQSPIGGEFDRKLFEQSGGWWRGLDNEMRMWVPDEGAKLKLGVSDLQEAMRQGFAQDEPVIGELRDVLDHPELFKRYPELGSVPLSLWDDPGLYGAYDRNKGAFEIMPESFGKEGVQSNQLLLDTLLHEPQHWIQDMEDFSPGTNSVAAGMFGKDYWKAAGEAEARTPGMVLRALSGDPGGKFPFMATGGAVPFDQQWRVEQQAGYGSSAVPKESQMLSPDLARRVSDMSGIGRRRLADADVLMPVLPEGEKLAGEIPWFPYFGRGEVGAELNSNAGREALLRALYTAKVPDGADTYELPWVRAQKSFFDNKEAPSSSVYAWGSPASTSPYGSSRLHGTTAVNNPLFMQGDDWLARLVPYVGLQKEGLGFLDKYFDMSALNADVWKARDALTNIGVPHYNDPSAMRMSDFLKDLLKDPKYNLYTAQKALITALDPFDAMSRRYSPEHKGFFKLPKDVERRALLPDSLTVMRDALGAEMARNLGYDAVIGFNALEHTEVPLAEMIDLRPARFPNAFGVYGDEGPALNTRFQEIEDSDFYAAIGTTALQAKRAEYPDLYTHLRDANNAKLFEGLYDTLPKAELEWLNRILKDAGESPSGQPSADFGLSEEEFSGFHGLTQLLSTGAVHNLESQIKLMHGKYAKLHLDTSFPVLHTFFEDENKLGVFNKVAKQLTAEELAWTEAHVHEIMDETGDAFIYEKADDIVAQVKESMKAAGVLPAP